PCLLTSFEIIRPLPRSTLFPYTTLFRSGVWAARVTAQLLDTDVDYLEDGSWSVYRYRTERAHGAISSGRADGPIIEVNIPQYGEDRKSTRLNSSHVKISYAVFCLKKKK